MNLNPEKFFEGKLLLLFQAALKNNDEEIKKLISQGVEINAIGIEGMTPLILAVIQQNRETIQVLLKNKADPLLIVPGTGSAVSIACRTENTISLNTLLDAGVAINTRIDEEPLTFVAARADNFPAIQILIKRGIPIDDRDGSGNTLLIESLLVNDINLVKWLVALGGNVHAINTFLISAAYILQNRFNETGGKGPNAPQYKELMKLFEMKGVKFPVPNKLDIEDILKKNFVSIDEAEKMNELGIIYQED